MSEKLPKINLDATTLAKLDGATRQVQLCNEAGELVGYLLPADAYLCSVDLGGPDPFSDADASAQLKAGDPGRPLADILRELRGE